MKWLLLLISINCFAQYEVHIKKSGITKNYATFDTLENANAWVTDNEKPIGNGFNSFGKISPKDYTVEILNKTSEYQIEQQNKTERLNDIASIKAIDIDIDNINGASPEVKQILKRLVKELKE